MTDVLLSLAQSPVARRLVGSAKLPIPLPEALARPDGALPERFLEGAQIALAGGELLGLIGRTLVRAGATPYVPDLELAEAFREAAQAYGRAPQLLLSSEPSEQPGAERLHLHGMVFDATGLRSPDALKSLYAFFHVHVRSLAKSGRVVVLGRPPEQANSVAEAATQAALEGFTRSLAKEVGGRGTTANLLIVEHGADERALSPLRFLLSKASAFVSAQPLRISSAVKADEEVSWTQPLDRKVALVTGAARGIGAATAAALAAEGAHVVCLDRPQDDEALGETARSVGGSVLTCDVTDPQAPATICAALKREHGGVDIVVHNAGVTRDKTIARMSESQWDMVLGINLAAVLSINDALLGDVLRDGGRVVSVSSIGGIAGNAGQTNYAASKAGIIGMTRMLAQQVASRGIAVNAVAPGFIETRMTAAMPVVIREAGRRLSALGQGGLPQDVAAAITFLATPGACGVSGQVLRVCGGALIGA